MKQIKLSSGLEIGLKVLKLLKKNKELKKHKDIDVYVGVFSNCRECGITFMCSKKSKDFTFCVYEHRNSDDIIINGKSGFISMNGELPYAGDSAHIYLKSFRYDKFQETADCLAKLIIEKLKSKTISRS